MPDLVLVTGANGFLGQHVCRTLERAGLRVRGLVRDPNSVDVGTCADIAVANDLTDRGALRAALRDVNAVVHLAARVHQIRDVDPDPIRAFRRVNVEGTRSLLDEAIAAGVRRFVFISTVKAVGEATVEPWTDETVPEPTDPYGISKLEAERLVLETAARAAVEPVVLRLPLLYGPGMKANMLRLFDLVWRGIPLPLGLVGNRRSLLFVENAADAILAVLRANAGMGETYFVSDGEDVSTPDLIRAIAVALDRRARLIPVPPTVLKAVGRCGDLLARFGSFPLTTAEVNRLLDSLVIDSSRIRRAVGFSPAHRLEDGLAITARWYREGRVRAG